MCCCDDISCSKVNNDQDHKTTKFLFTSVLSTNLQINTGDLFGGKNWFNYTERSHRRLVRSRSDAPKKVASELDFVLVIFYYVESVSYENNFVLY